MQLFRPPIAVVVSLFVVFSAVCWAQPSVLNPDNVTYDAGNGKFYGADGQEISPPPVPPYLKNRGWTQDPATGRLNDPKGGSVDPADFYPSPDTRPNPLGTTYDPTTKTFFSSGGGRHSAVVLPAYLYARGYRSNQVTGEISDPTGELVDPSTLFPAPSTDWRLTYDPSTDKYYSEAGTETHTSPTIRMQERGWSYDPATGQWVDPSGTRLAPEDVFAPPSDVNPNDLSFDPVSGKFFDANGDLTPGALAEFMTNQGWKINTSTGAITNPSGTTVDPATMFPQPSNNPIGYTYDPESKTFFGPTTTPPTPAYLEARGGHIDQRTGEIVEANGDRHDPSTYFAPPTTDLGLVYDPQTGRFYTPSGVETAPTLAGPEADSAWIWDRTQKKFIDLKGNAVDPSTLTDQVPEGDIPKGSADADEPISQGDVNAVRDTVNLIRDEEEVETDLVADVIEPIRFAAFDSWHGPAVQAGATAPMKHVVQPGENLFRLALRYGVSMDAIAAANGLGDVRETFAGQEIVIPSTPDFARPGDTPFDMSVLNTLAAGDGARLPTIQLEIVILSRTPVDSTPASGERAPAEGKRGTLASRRPTRTTPLVARAWTAPTTWRQSLGVHVAPESSEAPLAAIVQDEADEGPQLTGLFTALGGSTGDVFQAEFVNDGPAPIDIGANGLVLEPLAAKAQEAARNEFARAAAGKPTTKANVKAYCLEFVREPPAEGTVFRVAPPDVQNQFQSMRNVMRAAKRVLDVGGLTPDSDPTQYSDAIVQWSLWTKENGFDVKSFGEAFIDRTKKNFDAAKQPWTDQVEQIVRDIIPNRWSDIERVLGEADILEQAIRN